jgi:dTDP-4-amino-4,6-dideoxygalactose transaminase
MIPFFNYQALYKKDKKKILKVIDNVCKKGAFILQDELKQFERKAAKFIKAKYLIGVANGTDALILGLKAAGIKQGDEIIIPSHTYIATAAAIKLVGATPILTECKNDSMMDENDIEHRITKNTKAIMPVQLNGRCCNMDKIIKIAKKNKLQVFEDSAQGFGSKYKKKYAGNFGLFGTISFYPAKLLGCFGDGGAIVTNNKSFAKKIFLLRDHGRNEIGKVIDWGYNSRLDNLQAAILNFKLSNYKKDISKRRQIALLYHKHLKSIKQIKLPPPPSKGTNFDVYQNYEIQCDKRDLLIKYLKRHNIRCIIQWNGYAIHQIKELNIKTYLPKTDLFFKRCLMLPMNTAMSISDVITIISKVKKFYDK